MEKTFRKHKVIELSSPLKVDMADEWYKIANLDHFWIEWRFRSLLHEKVIHSLYGKRLFEIGCGNGLVIKQFESHGKIIVDGCDMNLSALQTINNIKGNIYLLNIYDKPKELINHYSGILLFDVIEHIDDDYDFLKTACSYLMPSGLVIINVPALNFLFSRYDRIAGHKRRYNKKMIIQLFEKNNIQKISIFYWGMLMIPIAIMRKFILFFIPDKRVIMTGFNPPTKLFNSLFKLLMKTELLLIRKPLLGTSIIAIGKYPSVKQC